MPVTNTIQSNFASGELSEKLRGRFDLKVYQNGLERLVNFIAETQGGARFRTGTRFINHTRKNKIAFLIPFQFNDEQSYALEFTDLMCRVYRDKAPVVEAAKTITGATQADPVVVTAVAHGYSNGDEVQIDSVGGMVELNGKSFLIANKAADTFELQDIDGVDIDGTGFTAYSTGGVSKRVFEFATPYVEADLFKLRFAQNADTMYITHRNYEPRKLTRVTDTNWTISTFTRTLDPFVSPNWPRAVAFFEGRIKYAGTADKPQTIWGSRTPDVTGGVRFDDFTTGTDDDHAVIFTITPSIQGKVDSIEWLAGNTEFLTVGTFGGITRVKGAGVDNPITPTSINAKPLTGDGTDPINPIPQGTILLYLQRGSFVIRSLEFNVLSDSFISVDRTLIADHITLSGIKQLAFQSGRPDILWSVRNDGVLAAVTFKPKEDVSGWHRHKLGGTNAKATSVTTITNPTDIDEVYVVAERTINSKTRRYVEVFENVPTIPEFVDFFTGDSNLIADINTFGNAMFEEQKKYVHVDSALTFDGSTRGKDAGATLTPAATTGNGITFTASQNVFTAADVGNELWKKSVNGVGEGRAVISSFTDAKNVDCNIKKDFDNTNAMAAGNWFLTAKIISNINHLEGETITPVVDGAAHVDLVVTDGAITLNSEASVVHVGLQFKGLVKTMNLEVGSLQTITQTRVRNIEKVGVKFLNTLGARVGTNRYQMQDVGFKSTAHFTNRPSGLFSGVEFVTFLEEWSSDKHLFIEQVRPLPCNIQLLDYYGSASEEG